jgi:ribonucleoside-triphosphate reductase
VLSEGLISMKSVEIISESERGKGVKFSRIRRITGYLVGSVDTWNSSKRAELRDRVKHVK